MAEKLTKVPAKGILKTSSSFESVESRKLKSKETKWDEMNIIATLHPPDKDYGHMKIEEPRTPYNYMQDGEGHSEDETDGLDADMLARKIQLGAEVPPKSMIESESEESEEEDLTPEERVKRKLFETKRKSHYNEFYAVKLARKLMAEDLDEEEEEEEPKQKQIAEEDEAEEANGEEQGKSEESENEGHIDKESTGEESGV